MTGSRNGVIDWHELGSSFGLQMNCLAQCTCVLVFRDIFLPSEPLVSWHNSALVESCAALRCSVLQIHLFVSEMDFWILKPSHPRFAAFLMGKKEVWVYNPVASEQINVWLPKTPEQNMVGQGRKSNTFQFNSTEKYSEIPILKELTAQKKAH